MTSSKDFLRDTSLAMIYIFAMVAYASAVADAGEVNMSYENDRQLEIAKEIAG